MGKEAAFARLAFLLWTARWACNMKGVSTRSPFGNIFSLGDPNCLIEILGKCFVLSLVSSKSVQWMCLKIHILRWYVNWQILHARKFYPNQLISSCSSRWILVLVLILWRREEAQGGQRRNCKLGLKLKCLFLNPWLTLFKTGLYDQPCTFMEVRLYVRAYSLSLPRLCSFLFGGHTRSKPSNVAFASAQVTRRWNAPFSESLY